MCILSCIRLDSVSAKNETTTMDQIRNEKTRGLRNFLNTR